MNAPGTAPGVPYGKYPRPAGKLCYRPRAPMNGPVARFLMLLCVLDGRTREEVIRLVGCSAATVKRCIADAKAMGVVIEAPVNQNRRAYRIIDPGPFDLARLRRVRWVRV